MLEYEDFNSRPGVRRANRRHVVCYCSCVKEAFSRRSLLAVKGYRKSSHVLDRCSENGYSSGVSVLVGKAKDTARRRVTRAESKMRRIG